jgi:hypothetical protein
MTRWWVVGSMAFAGVAAAGCGHNKSGSPREPEAKQAVAETRGRCPTDLNETQVAVNEKDDRVRLIFMTSDPSQNEELYRRVTELGNALANVHPMVNERGELVKQAPMPKPELREAAMTSGSPSRYGWELVMQASDEQSRQALKTSLDDRVRLWRQGECPELRDQPVGPRPDPQTDTDRGGSQTPGIDR